MKTEDVFYVFIYDW